MRTRNGYPVVLTADRTLTANYRVLFDGMLVANQTTTTPRPIVRTLMMPRPHADGARAHVAPLGLRRIEAALLRNGFGPDEVAVVDHDHLRDAVGPATRIVAVSTGDPLGLGMSTTTVQAIAGGRGYPEVMFRDLVRTIRRLIANRVAQAVVVAGGPGAWQFGKKTDVVDHVVTGYAEGNVAAVFRSVMRGDTVPPVIQGEPVPPERVPRIAGATTMGVVEVSRGCGLGCRFCTMAHTPMRHLPEDAVAADAQTNVAAGVDNICAVSEDLFRYGADGRDAAPDALISLLTRLREIRGLRLIQTDHGNIATISQYGDRELAQVRSLLVGGTGQKYPWLNVGVETASGELLAAAGCGTKLGPGGEDGWAGLCTKQLKRLVRAGFFPMASIVVGLPGETAEDTRHTLAWVESVSGECLAVFPMLYAPIDGTTPEPLNELQWHLIRSCYAINFRRVPAMYGDNQRAGGGGLARRCLMRALGGGQVALWKMLLARRSRRAARAGNG